MTEYDFCVGGKNSKHSKGKKNRKKDMKMNKEVYTSKHFRQQQIKTENSNSKLNNVCQNKKHKQKTQTQRKRKQEREQKQNKNKFGGL